MDPVNLLLLTYRYKIITGTFIDYRDHVTDLQHMEITSANYIAKPLFIEQVVE